MSIQVPTLIKVRNGGDRNNSSISAVSLSVGNRSNNESKENEWFEIWKVQNIHDSDKKLEEYPLRLMGVEYFLACNTFEFLKITITGNYGGDFNEFKEFELHGYIYDLY